MSTHEALISNRMADEINAQIGREMAASLQYVSIASYFDRESLPQLATFFFRQSDEERMHAMRFVRFMLETDAQVAIPAIPETPAGFDSAEDAVAAALRWERQVTHDINDLMATAMEERNFIARQFLDWFVAEQLEEVATMGELLDVVKRAGDNLLAVEQYLVTRPDPHAGEGQ